MLCLLVYYWQDGEKGHEYTWLNEVTEATFPGFGTYRHVGVWLISYWCSFWDFGTLSLHQLWKVHVPESLCLGNFQWGTHVHLELGFLSCCPRLMCPTYQQTPLQHLNRAENHVKFQLRFLQGQRFQLWCFILPEAMKYVQISSCLPRRADLSFGWSVQLWSYCSFALGAGTLLWVANVLSQNFLF